MNNIDQEKVALRKEMRQIKKQYSFEKKLELSKNIWEKIEANNFFINASVVLSYWSMDDEVNTHEFVTKWSSRKTILLPRIKGEELELVVFSPDTKMNTSESFHILEPVGNPFLQYDKIDFSIIPGVAFDKNNNRMGRGKAYYDKLLPKLKSVNVGVCFNFQLIEKIPSDRFDIKMDYVITNNY